MTLLALVSCIILGLGSLAWEYSRVGLNPISIWLILFGALWFFALRRGWDWFSSLGLFVAVFAAAVGLWFEFNTEWMIAGVIFALFAWDLTEFRRRLRYIAPDDDLRGMERRHLARISIVILAGLFLVTCALFLQLHFTFEWGVLLVLVILLGLAQLAVWFRRENG
jgi:hypothetical protein